MNTNKPSRAVPFVLGLILGVLGMIFLPDHVRPYIPESMTGKAVAVKGIVTAKEKKNSVLLLTVNTPDGALLATFKRKVDEINLLVNEKDTLEFTLPKYLPFIDDPKIIRVVKEQPQAPEAKPEEKSTKEVKPGKQEKPRASSPAPGGSETKPAERK